MSPQNNKIQTTRFMSKGDTKQNWSVNNPILLTREVGYELDTNSYKIGDGVTHWNELPYATIGIKDNDKIILQSNQVYLSDNKKLLTKDDLPAGGDTAGGVGQATADGGEIFNDYDNNIASGDYSHAEGSHTRAEGCFSHAEGIQTTALSKGNSAKGIKTIAGCRGYWYSSVGNVTEGDVIYSTIILTTVHNAEMVEVWTENDVCGYQIGDIISIIADSKYYNCATIRSINNNIITLNENLDEVLDSPKYTYDDGFDGNVIYVISKPDIGIADIGIASSVEGGSHKNSEVTGAVGPFTHVEGRNNKAIGHYSHAEGRGNNALNIAAHVEGQNSIAEGVVSHAEGATCSAIGSYSHAEGNGTKAKGHISHTEGTGTETGENTVAAHAQGYRTKATANFQDVSGKFNKIDNTKAVIVGNGDSDTDRSNAYELDWKGNAWFAGSGEFSSIILRSSTPNSTKKFKLSITDDGKISVNEII